MRKNIDVIVNGEPRTFAVETIDYARLVRVARMPDGARPTITWRRRSGTSGTIAPGETLALAPGMTINVTMTGAA